MTKLEFYEQYQRLHKAWPAKFMTDNPTRLRSIFELWQELKLSDLRSLIDRMLHTNNPDFDLVKTAMSLKRAKLALERTEKMLEVSPELNEKAYHEALASFKAASLVEAVMKARKGNQDGN